ncbi:hypothetical protein [uncultured Celeribacter sp.]|uniref:hypothetical protein n=1 Tax=uncultured Celeribacter sp. TaxID=1303376 RepID=UPI002AA9253F|nr:hypothetical protein [uncultured Celeribacter sp.]
MTTDTDLNFDDMNAPEAVTSSDPGAHLDSFRAPDIDGETFADDDPIQIGEDGEPLAGQIEPERMSREAFAAVFRLSFNMPGMMLPDFKPLAITDEKEEPFADAADAAYNLCEMYFPSILLASNDTFAAIMRMTPFLIMQTGAVRAILIERRKAKAATVEAPEGSFKSSRTPEAANVDAPPMNADEEAA